jgi:hypothetical protein
VFTLPAPIAAVAYQNKAVIYDLLFKAAADTMLTIAADPKHLGARIGITAVLHTWGSARGRIRSPQLRAVWFRSLLPQQAWPQCALKRRSGVTWQLLVASPVTCLFSN